jgi:glycosyl transferase family 25
MIRNLPYVTEPADSQLKSWWDAGVYPFGLIPYCVAHDDEGASDINPGGALEGMQQSRYAKIINKIKRASMRLWSTPQLNRRFRAFADNLNHES